MRLTCLCVYLAIVASFSVAQAAEPFSGSGTTRSSLTTRPGDLNDMQLDSAIAALNDPTTCAAAYGKILRFVQNYEYHMGSMVDAKLLAELNADPILNTRVEKAKTALKSVTIDIPFIKLALAEPDSFLNGWALQIIQRPHGITFDYKSPELLALLPAIRTFARGTDPILRRAAQGTLSAFGTERAFLESLIQDETEPDNILFMARFDSANNTMLFNRTMNAQLVRLLHSDQSEIRYHALSFISFNRNSAPMYHCTFNADVVTAVAALTATDIHRGTAAGALAQIADRAPEISMPVLRKLAADKDRDVRYRIAINLITEPLDLASDPDFTPSQAELLPILYSDKDDEVRFEAILGLGPVKHIADLQALTHSDNPIVALNARQMLDRITPSK